MDVWENLAPSSVREVEVSVSVLKSGRFDRGLEMWSKHDVALNVSVGKWIVNELKEERFEE